MEKQFLDRLLTENSHGDVLATQEEEELDATKLKIHQQISFEDEDISDTDPLIKKTDVGVGETKQPEGGCWSCFGFCEQFKTLKSAFGGRFLVMIVCVQWLLKGLGPSFSNAANPYLFRSIGHVDATDLQVFSAIIALPWAMKPMMGLYSDFLPINGYHKQLYMMPMNLCCIICATIVVCMWPLSAAGLVVCGVLITYNTAQSDLFMEAMYSAKIKEHPTAGPLLISFITAGQSALGLLSSIATGPIIQYAGPQYCYTVPLAVALILVLPLHNNFMGERQKVYGNCLEVAKQKYKEDKKLLVMASVVGSIAIGYMAVGMIENFPQPASLLYTLTTSALLCIAMYRQLDRVIFRVVFFTFIQSLLSPSIGSATYYFSTDTAKQYPAGPHFDPSFYVTAVGVVGSLVGLISIAIYNRFMTNCR